MGGGPRRPLAVLEAGAPLQRQGRAHQADTARLGRRRVVEPPALRRHHQTLRAEGDGQAVAGAAIGQEPALGGAGGGQEVGEDEGPVIAAQEVALTAAARQEGEVGFVAAAAVRLQAGEEEGEEGRVCRDGAALSPRPRRGGNGAGGGGNGAPVWGRLAPVWAQPPEIPVKGQALIKASIKDWILIKGEIPIRDWIPIEDLAPIKAETLATDQMVITDLITDPN